jgi:2Fe-2S ferredoxin
MVPDVNLACANIHARDAMPKIRILPLDIEIEARPDATVMGAAQDLGYYWPTTCGGEGRCTTCACEVIEGASLLSGMGRAERRSLVDERGESVLRTNVRLACQARIVGDGTIVVNKPGVREPGRP